MSAMPTNYSNDPVFLRHDLMIEIGRIDMALEEFRERVAANEQAQVLESLRKRRATLNDALTRLAV
ncbi:MAG: hypothetical protein LW860_09570 [Xanthomonadaceae bacterium]|jgi:hypothetical protein|nr:hypothetical protein [Xanthomonadaceae bacterium]